MCAHGRVGQTHIDIAPRHSLKEFCMARLHLHLNPARFLFKIPRKGSGRDSESRHAIGAYDLGQSHHTRGACESVGVLAKIGSSVF